jgi:hypothetical protein
MARKSTPQPPPADDPLDDVWGHVPDDEEDIVDEALGTPPPAPAPSQQTSGIAGEKAGPPPRSLKKLGPPPDDAVGAAKWAYQMQMKMAYHAAMDPKMTPSQRRKEVRIILAGAQKHMNDAMRYDVAKILEDNARQLEAKKRGKAQAKTEKRPVVAGAKIIPIRRDG